MIKNPVFNPYLPPYEYIADAEPRVFGERLYIFGSHDRFGGEWYCENDYVAWSAPTDDLSDFRYEGVIYTKGDDGDSGNLFAPDVVRGADGRYYLYYSKDDTSKIGVAVCPTPAGKYEFLDFVKYPDGRVLGGSEDDFFMFDPSVLMDGERIFLYSGSSVRPTSTKIVRNMAGCTVCELCSDMVTVKSAPKVVLPGGESWDEDIFFEAPSARHIGKYYYLIYAVRSGTGLHYAMSEYPDRDFSPKGILFSVSGIGDGIHTRTSPAYPMGNEHGGLVQIGNDLYIFNHRHTNNCGFCRQGVAEKVEILPDGTLSRAEYTSGGFSNVLNEQGYCPAYSTCHLTGNAFISMTGKDGDTDVRHYICGDGKFTAGFRYFDFSGGKYRINVNISGAGRVEVSLTESGEPIAASDYSTDSPTLLTLDADIPCGKRSLYFRITGNALMYGLSIKKA